MRSFLTKWRTELYSNLSQCGYLNTVFLLSLLSIFHQLPCITSRVPSIGNQIVYMIHNIAVCSYNCSLARNAFQPSEPNRFGTSTRKYRHRKMQTMMER